MFRLGNSPAGVKDKGASFGIDPPMHFPPGVNFLRPGAKIQFIIQTFLVHLFDFLISFRLELTGRSLRFFHF